MLNTTNAVPNPGTREAIDRGCTCPIIDNCYGQGYRRQFDVFVYSGGCPVHAPTPVNAALSRPSPSHDGGEG